VGQITVDGVLQAGPPNGAAPCAGGGVLNAQLRLRGGAGTKPYQVASGLMQFQLLTATPTTYQTLPGIGSTPGVTKGDTGFFFASAPIRLRMTFDTGSVDLVSEVPLDGLLVYEVPGTLFLKLLEAAGTAAIEYLVTGPQ
jgi:hypothetical protein